MDKVNSSDGLLATIVRKFENTGTTLYSSLRETASRLGANPDDLPEEALAAAEVCLKINIMKLHFEAIHSLEKMFKQLRKPLEDANDAKLLEVHDQLHTQFMFLGALAKSAIEDADWEYLVDVAIEEGQKRHAAENSPPS